MKKNMVKEKLKNGGTVLGAFQAYESEEFTEILGLAGFDFVVLDAEHGPFYPGQLEGQIRAAECCGCTAMARVPSFQRQDILKPLDRGAAGILVPMVNTKGDAQLAVSWARYAPEGNRGLTFSSRAAGYNVRVNQEEHLKTSNCEIMVMLQIETREAVSNLDEILTVPGIDLIFIGPSDLSQSFGVPGQVTNPEVESCICEIIEKSQSAGISTGIFANTAEASVNWMEKGVRLLLAGSQGIVAKAVSGYVDEIQNIMK